MVSQVCDTRQQHQDAELGEGALFINRIYHLDVKHRWFIEAARGVVEEDECVFEEPRVDDECERYADESGLCGDREQQCENEHDCGGASPCGTQEVTQQI